MLSQGNEDNEGKVLVRSRGTNAGVPKVLITLLWLTPALAEPYSPPEMLGDPTHISPGNKIFARHPMGRAGWVRNRLSSGKETGKQGKVVSKAKQA